MYLWNVNERGFVILTGEGCWAWLNRVVGLDLHGVELLV